MKMPIHELRWIEASNAGASDIPAFALIEITGATMDSVGHLVLDVVNVTADNVVPIAINSMVPIKAGAKGVVTLDGPTFCLYATANTPAFGEQWGASLGTWRAAKDKAGLMVIGAIDTTKEIVLVDFDKANHYRPIIDFSLTAAMTTSDPTQTATIDQQLGLGVDNPNTGSGEITVYNARQSVAATYVYYGDSGDRGRAYHIGENDYAIVELECP